MKRFAAFRLRLSMIVVAVIVLPTCSLRADIYQWQCINPADASQGKQPSTTLCPDGAGLNPEPGATFQFVDLTKAYLIDANLQAVYSANSNLTASALNRANLSSAYFEGVDFTNADLGEADLKYAAFVGSTLIGANLSGAKVRGIDFSCDLTAAQLFTTARYSYHDIR